MTRSFFPPFRIASARSAVAVALPSHQTPAPLAAPRRTASGMNMFARALVDRGGLTRAQVHAAIDHGRLRARRPVPMAELPERSAPAPADGDPELWRAVRELPRLQRAAVVHRYVLDRSYRDVAEALGCSEEAARASAHEAR